MFVADFSVVVRGITDIIAKKGKVQLLVPAAVVSQVEMAANANRESGFAAMKELEKLRELSKKGKIDLAFSGVKPRFAEDIGFMVRETARMEDAVLLTADRIQASLARAEGIEVEMHEPDTRPKLSVEKYFDEMTMSVHLRDGMPVLAKRGEPGKWRLEKITDKPLTTEEVESVLREIIEKANVHPDAFIEVDREGGTIVQYDKFRIVLCRPPFSDGYEVTLVRPIAKLTLEDYGLDEKLESRIKEKAEGILIAGAPGQGKSTLATAIAEYYAAQEKIVKTMESPRDLQVSQGITQYSPLEGSMEKTADILLLARPDYTIYDELRKTPDFETFTDMRLAGVGMVGVTHASKPIDAIQRFLGRTEMGVIPQIIDTVLFIEGGKVTSVLTLKMTVKVPTGMMEADLARPVVEVKDFFSDEVKYEIYTYGEETTIVPVTEQKLSGGAFAIAAKRIADVIASEAPGAYVQAQVVSPDRAVVYIDESAIPQIIGRGGKNIEQLESRLGIHLDIKPATEKKSPSHKKAKIEFDVSDTKTNFVLHFDKRMEGRSVDIHADGEFALAAVVSRKGKLKFAKKSEIGKKLSKAKKIEVKA